MEKNNVDLELEILQLKNEIKNFTTQKLNWESKKDGNCLLGESLAFNQVSSGIWKVILDTIPFGIFIYGSDGVLYANNFVKHILGYSVEEYMTFDLKKLNEFLKLKKDDNLKEIINNFDNYYENSLNIEEFQMKKKNGENAWVQSIHFPLLLENGDCFANIGCIIDITNRKEMELRLTSALVALKESQQREITELNKKNIDLQFENIKQVHQNYSIIHFSHVDFISEMIKLTDSLINKDLSGSALKKAKSIKKKYILDDKKHQGNGFNHELINHINPILYKKLININSELTKSELKICSLFKQQLVTPQIANLLHLSNRTIEFHKNNIRKKLGLKREEKLEQFLIKISDN